MAEHLETHSGDDRSIGVTAPPTTVPHHQPSGRLVQWVLNRLEGRVPLKTAAAFWQQLVLLIEVGVPLLKALHQVEKRTSHPTLQRIIRQIAEDIERGSSFSDALVRHPGVFSRLTVQIIQVAERGGVIDSSLRLIANELERHVEIRSKLKRVLAYPVIVALVGALVVIFVLTFVIPEFAGLFHEQGMPLPWATRMIIFIANFLTHYWWLCILGVIVIEFLLWTYIRTPNGRLHWDRFKLRLPLVGHLLTRAGVLRFAQTMGTLLRGGVPILVSLKLVQEHAENSVLAADLARACTAVDQGNRLEEPLRQSIFFPASAVDLIAIGEEAGQLDTVLFKLAETYEQEVDHTASIFSSIIEPLLLLLVGLFVALIVWAVYLPYFSLASML